jgi:hypothetical protein
MIQIHCPVSYSTRHLVFEEMREGKWNVPCLGKTPCCGIMWQFPIAARPTRTEDIKRAISM